MARRFSSTIDSDFLPFIEQKGKDGYGYVHVYQKDKKYSGKVYVRFGTVIAVETSTYRTNVLQRILDMPDLNERNADLISSRFSHDPQNILIAEAALDQQMTSAPEARKLIKENFIDSFYELWTWDKVQLDWVANKEPSNVPTVPAIAPEKLLEMVRRTSEKINHEIPQILGIAPGALINCRLQIGSNRDYSALRHIDQVLLSKAETGMTLNEIVNNTGQSRSVSQLAIVSMWMKNLLNLITEDGHVVQFIPEEEPLTEETPNQEEHVENLEQEVHVQSAVLEDTNVEYNEPTPNEYNAPEEEHIIETIQPFNTVEKVDYGVLDDGDYDYLPPRSAPVMPEQPEVEEPLENSVSIFDSEEDIGAIFDSEDEPVQAEPEAIQKDEAIMYTPTEPVLKPQIDYFAEALASTFTDELMASPEPAYEEITYQEEATETHQEEIIEEHESQIAQEISIFDTEDSPVQESEEEQDIQPETEVSEIEESNEEIQSETEVSETEESNEEIHEETSISEESSVNHNNETETLEDSEENHELNSQEDLEREPENPMSEDQKASARTRIKDRLAAHLNLLKEETEASLSEINTNIEEFSGRLNLHEENLRLAENNVTRLKEELQKAEEEKEHAEKVLSSMDEEHNQLIEAKEIAQEDYDTVIQQLEEYQKGE